MKVELLWLIMMDLEVGIEAKLLIDIKLDILLLLHVYMNMSRLDMLGLIVIDMEARTEVMQLLNLYLKRVLFLGTVYDVMHHIVDRRLLKLFATSTRLLGCLLFGMESSFPP